MVGYLEVQVKLTLFKGERCWGSYSLSRRNPFPGIKKTSLLIKKLFPQSSACLFLSDLANVYNALAITRGLVRQ